MRLGVFTVPCAAGPRAAAPSKPCFGLLGTQCSGARTKILCPDCVSRHWSGVVAASHDGLDSRFSSRLVYREFMKPNEKAQRNGIQRVVEARKQKEKAFFELAGRFRASNDPEKVKQLGDELGRFVFGQIPIRTKF